MLLRLCVIFLLSSFAVLQLPGQVDRSVLNGTITDASGAGVPNASIELNNIDRGYSRQALTGADGGYRITGLPVGAYKVTVSKEGFSVSVFDDVRMEVGIARTLDARLQVGSVNTQVAVTASVTPIEQSSADIGSVIGMRQVKDIPINGRNWTFLMMLAPGAINSGEGNQNSIRFFGRYRDENNWTFDGVDATGIKDPRQEGGLRTVISLDSIAEFKVNSSSYTAESGNAAGGQVNLVSKSGTNQFHGSAFEYFRNSALDARRPFDPATVPPFRLNQFGANAGGPILRERLFFFANFEALRQRLTQQTVSGTVPSLSYRSRVASTSPALKDVVNAYPVGQSATADPEIDRFDGQFRQYWNENAGSIRVDYMINSKNFLFGRLNTTDGSFNDRRSALLEYRTSYVRPTNATLQWQAVFRPTLINEVKLGVNRSALERPDTGLLPESVQIPGFTTTTATTAIQEVPTSYAVVDNLTWMKGRHTIKAGGEIRRIHLNNANLGTYSIRYSSRANFVNNSMDRFETAGRLPMWGGRRTYWLGYLQDEWRVTPKLILNLGLRYENYTVMDEVNGRGKVFDANECQGFCASGTPWYYADQNNFAPRVGVAYSFSPKTVLRAGYGIFYGPGQNDDVTAAIDSEPERFQLTASQQPGLSYPIAPFLGAARSQGVQPRAFQRDHRDFYSQQWSLSLQQEIPAGFVAQVSYVGNHGTKLFGRDRVNTYYPGTTIRQLAAFADIDRKNNWGNSSFSGLQASLQRNFTNGLLFHVQYLYSHGIDDNAGSGDGQEIMNTWCRVCERASSDFDVRQTATINGVYELPFGPGRAYGAKSGFGGKLIQGWDVSGVYTVRTGRSVNVLVDRSSTAVPDGNARGQRPDLTGLNPIPPNQTPSRYFDPLAFIAPKNGTWGNAPRNILRGPDLWQVDFSLTKRTPIKEGISLDFRAEAFNLFNRAQFGNPASNISNPNFGIILTTANDGATGFGTSRQLQFMLRLNF